MSCSNSPGTEALRNRRCRLRLTLDGGDGTEAEIEIDVEEWLRGPFDPQALGKLPSRISAILAAKLVPTFRKELWRWGDSLSPSPSHNFEDEFVRRCDHNDQAICALEWIAPHIASDEEREWETRMVDVLMARYENELIR